MLWLSGRFWSLCMLVLVVSQLAVSAQILSIAHRGNSLFAPENTLAACLAAQGKADMVEIDVRVSSDGQLVLMHDTTVDRTTDGSGTVTGKTLAQLKLLDAGSWFGADFAGERIPLLAEMITNTLPFAVPLIEHKAGSAAAYVSELRRLNVVSDVVLQSFDWNFLAAVHALEPAVRLCALGSGTLDAAILTTITNTGARIVAWEKSSVNPSVVNLVQSRGLTLFVWTVDGPDIQNFLDLGVDGIISNDPGMVRQLQAGLNNSPIRLEDRLVAYWKMDDGLADPFSSSVKDSAGENAGALFRNDGASHWLAGEAAKVGGCLKLEGTNAYVVFPQTPALDLSTNEMTFSAWVRLLQLPSQLSTSFGAIFDSTTDCYVLYLDRTNRELRFKVTDELGHAARPGIPEGMLPLNQWLHVAATYSGRVGPVSGQTTIYLNGQPRDVHTGNDGQSPFGLTGNVKAGQIAAMGREGPTGGNYFTGFVDDVALWKRALSPAEIKHLFNGGQNQQSLGDLLPQPTALIEFVSVRKLAAPETLEIQFRSLGRWQSFRLLRAIQPGGPFHEVEDNAPMTLGNGEYRFNYPLSTNVVEYFRVEGW